MSGYEGTLDTPTILHGLIEASRLGVRVEAGGFRATSENLSNEMEFDHVIFSDGRGKVYDVQGIWAPVAHQYTDDHGEWLPPELEGPTHWSLMDGYSGQYGYGGPWMHESEFIGGRMAEDILSTPGLYVAIYPATINAQGEHEDADTWAVAYISENIPGSMPGQA